MARPTQATSPVARAIRAAMLAACSAGLAVAAHAAGGGGLPDIGTTILLTVMLAGAGTAAADRQRGPVTITVMLGVTQFALHVTLTWTSGLAHHLTATSPNPWVMLAGHALAVVGTGLVLARAEAALFVVAGALAALLPTLPFLSPVSVVALVIPTCDAKADPTRTVLLRRLHARRGPPVCP